MRNHSYRIFTLCHGSIEPGALVQPFTLACGKTIAAILIGHRGRGGVLGVLPVSGVKLDDTGEAIITAARIGKTQSGKPKLVAAESASSDEYAIVVMRLIPGWHCGIGYDGDTTGFARESFYAGRIIQEEDHYDFPGEILIRGVVTNGHKGGAGTGLQCVAVVGKGMIFSTTHGGAQFRFPSRYYYVFDGVQVLVASRQERDSLPEQHPLAMRRRT